MAVFELEDPSGTFEVEADTPETAVATLKKLKAAAGDKQPTSLPELTGGLVTRGAFEAAGGVAGGIAGSGLGLPGTLAGGALGAAGGSLAFDNIEGFLEFLGVLDPKRQTTGEKLTGSLIAAGKAGAMDVTGAGAGMILGQMFRSAKPLLGKILGVRGPEVDAIVLQAKNAGLTTGGVPALGAVDVMQGGKGRVARGASKVLGIFPFIGSPFRKAATEKAAVVIDRVNDTLNAMAPTATMADDLGVDMVRAARNSQQEFRSTAGRLYENFRSLARPAGNIVPTAPLKARAAAADIQAGRERIDLGDEVLEGAAADQMSGLLARWQKLPEFITVDQMQGQANLLKQIADAARAEGFDISRFVEFKKGIEEAISNLQLSGLPKAEADAISGAKKAADNFFAKGIATFQTSTAQKFGRVDKNIFKFGPDKPGSLNEDELASVALNLKSPQAVRDLATLVGKENMGKAARVHVERAWDDSLIFKDGQITGINWEQFRKNIGLTAPRALAQADKAQGLRELISQSGINMKQVEDLISVASKIEVPKDVNTFIARRAALGGLKSAAAAVTMTSLAGEGVLSMVGVGLLLRYGGRILSSPIQLEAMRRVLVQSTPAAQKRAILGKLFENLLQSREEVGEVQERQRTRVTAESLGVTAQ